MAFQRIELPSPTSIDVGSKNISWRNLTIEIIPELWSDSENPLNLTIVNFSPLRIAISIRARGVSSDLSSRFETNGAVVFEQPSTSSRLVIRTRSRDRSSTYIIRATTEERPEWTEFYDRLDTSAPIFLELWDDQPPAPVILTGPDHDGLWQRVLHDSLQNLPLTTGIPSLRERVFPDVIPSGQGFDRPHVVWYETGEITTGGFEGRFESGVRVTIDFRCPNRFECVHLRRFAIGHLKTLGIIERVVNTAALYDYDTKLRREIVDVIIRPIINPQSIRLIRQSPWAAPFGRQFG